MAGTKTNFWKLGLFVVVGAMAAMGSLFWLAARNRKTVVERVTYFNESVQGLDLGAPVKFRGVTVGKVSDISIASDRRLVAVTSEVYADVLDGLGLVAVGGEREATVPNDMRVQLATTGITGVKFLLVDFFKGADDSPELSFVPPPGYIPSTPSTLKSVEDSLRVLTESLPAAMAKAEELLGTVNRKAEELDVAAMSAEVERVFQRLNAQLEAFERADFIVEASALMTDLREAATFGRELLARFQTGDDPLGRALSGVQSLAKEARSAVANAELGETTRSLRETSGEFKSLAGDAGDLMGDLHAMVRQLNTTLASIESLAAFLERQPGAVLRGRKPDSPPRGGQE